MATWSPRNHDQIHNPSSGSEELGAERKRKRMLSNRESARRCRQKKQKQLEDLRAQVSQMKTQNDEIKGSINVTTQLYLDVEAENSILRAQLGELSNRLQSLDDIIHCVSASTTLPFGCIWDEESFGGLDVDCFWLDKWAVPFSNHCGLIAYP